MIVGWGICCEIAIRWIWISLVDLTDYRSMLVQVMAWHHQAANHYFSQCWTRSMSHMAYKKVVCCWWWWVVGGGWWKVLVVLVLVVVAEVWNVIAWTNWFLLAPSKTLTFLLRHLKPTVVKMSILSLLATPHVVIKRTWSATSDDKISIMMTPISQFPMI